jgi:hypothetical protein|eukprot:COSAG02_NODE_698_length_18377_cov_8.715067_3_plen_68_part_00
MSAPAAAAFAHLDPKSGVQQPYSPEDNARIVAALQSGASAVRLSDVALPNGTTLRFEVRVISRPLMH